MGAVEKTRYIGEPIGYTAKGRAVYPLAGGDGTDELTHSQSVNRLEDITTELERLGEKDVLSTQDEAYFDQLHDEFRSVDQHRKRLERAAKLADVKNVEVARVRDAVQGGRIERGTGPSSDEILEPDSIAERRFRNPWDLSEVRTFGRDRSDVSTELRARALSAIERMPYTTDSVREATTLMIEGADEGNRLSQLCLATSSPEYLRAFSKLVAAKGDASRLDGVERDAYTRAMSLTDAAGGFLVPFQLDPTVILTANGSRNAIRQIARNVTITGDVWNGISSAGVTGSWDAEAAEVSDDSPTFAQPSIPVYKGAVFVAASIEVVEDSGPALAGEIARMVAFEKDRMESEAFVTGTGAGMPTGIVTALTGTASEVAAATADTFGVADVYALDNSLPDRYAGNASWLAHRAVYNLVRRFDTSGGASLWETLGNGLPAQLLGRPAYTAESMDSTVTATAANYLMVFGDFTNYVIVDRVGTAIEYIPHLMGANRRPTGQRGWYAHFRVGADSVNDAAFRMLNA
jgi:HK97 family phage major capsid protein